MVSDLLKIDIYYIKKYKCLIPIIFNKILIVLMMQIMKKRKINEKLIREKFSVKKIFVRNWFNWLIYLKEEKYFLLKVNLEIVAFYLFLQKILKYCFDDKTIIIIILSVKWSSISDLMTYFS